MSRATITDIAKEVGVSVSTVSKVLNGRKDVASSTRARIEDALVSHNYRRRGSAVQTSSGSANLVELVIHNVDTPWALEIIKGVERVAAEKSVGVVLSQLGGEHRPSQDWVNGVLERRPIGVVLVLTELEERQQKQLQSRDIPFVVVDTFGQTSDGIPVVGSNNWNGGLVATRHLIELGHERIAVISGPKSYPCSRARVDGYRSAHEEAGLEWDPNLIRWGDFDLAGGYNHGLALLDRPDRPTAVFGGSDYQALGVLRAARRLGLRVPEDVSVMGYDDIPMSQWISPELSTVHQPLQEMGATATRMLLRTEGDDEKLPDRIDLATHLVVRASTARPPAA